MAVMYQDYWKKVINDGQLYEKLILRSTKKKFLQPTPFSV